VDAGIPPGPEKRFGLRLECIHNLLPRENRHGMIAGYHRYNVPLRKREHVGKRDAFSPGYAGSIRKGWGDGEDIFPAERAAGRFTGKGERLIDMPLEPFRTDPAPEAGQVFLTVL